MAHRAIAVAAAVLVTSVAHAGEGGHCHDEAPPTSPHTHASATEIAIPDATLVERDGRRVRLREDVFGDGIVVVDFVYTTCTTICPVLSSLFTGVQERLGGRLGADVRMVSLSVDPVRDTPARLAAYATRHKAKRAWSWLTGERDEVERVLRAMRVWTPSFADHAPVVLVGDPRRGTWVRFNGFPKAEAVVAEVERLLAARTASHEGTP